MIEKPTVTDLLKKSENRYELVIMTSRRARQISNGDKPLTDVNEDSTVTIAANEIAEGKVSVAKEDEKETEELNDEKGE